MKNLHKASIAVLAFAFAATSAFAGWRDTKTSSDTLTAADYNRIIDASWDELGGNIWRSSGSVGIGVTAPSSTLDIVGDLEVGGTDFFVDDSAGRVGIGTAAPGYTLDVSGTVNATTVSIGGTAITATGAELNYVDGVTSAIQTQLDAKAPTATPTFTTSIIAPLVIGGTATTSDLSFQTTSGVGATGADMHFLVGNNGGTEAMTILNSGNVGIGTTSPSGPLHVALSSDSSFIRFDNDAVGDEYINFGNDTTDLEIEFVNDIEGSYVLGIDDSDNLFHIAAASTDLETNTALTINQSGYVGIGTTAPSYEFSVATSAATNDAVFFYDNADVGDTTDGQSLQIYRRAAEGDKFLDLSVDNNGVAQIRADTNMTIDPVGDLYLESNTGANIYLASTQGDTVLVGSSWMGARNPTFRHMGYITAATNEKYVDWQVDDTTDNFELSREDTNIGYFDIQMPALLTGGNVGIGATTPAALLEVNQAAAATILDIQDGGSSVFTIADGGAITYPTVSPKRSIILTSAGAVTPTTSGAAQTKVDGTNHSYYVLDYDADADEAAYWHWTMPDSYDAGTVDVTFYWEAAATTGDTVWAAQTAGVAPDNAEDIDPTLGAAQTVTDTAQGNANDLASATVSAWNTGWAAGDYITFKVYRDADNASDTMTGDARLVKVKIEYGANAESD